MPLILTYKVERLKVIPGQPHAQQTCFIRPGSRRGRWKFFENGAVPEFEGDHAFFEIERKGPLWIFHGQVTKPAWKK